MKKSLLLCFIHGFKGGDSTFGDFPEYLRTIVNHALPNIDVQSLVYPRYETRGDLEECVKEFKEWLLEKVIDLEVKNGVDSPTVNPSVRVILIGHSMGGIVATDAALSISLDQPIKPSSSLIDPEPAALNTFIFPYVQGVLAFDTPYFGISPGVIAHLCPPKWTLTQLSDLSGMFWRPNIPELNKKPNKNLQNRVEGVNPPKSEASQSWMKITAIAGSSLALAAGGATLAYLNRETISKGWSWASSHLEFVSCLTKHADLQKRTQGMVTLNSELGVAYGNIYTCLGKKANKEKASSTRTFCIVPKTDNAVFWHEAINDDAETETSAHTAMFFPRKNPGYYAMSQKAKSLIAQWITDK